MQQVGVEMNQTYEGRFVFSGWRTHIPPVLTSNETIDHDISQTFSAKDIESTKAFHRTGAEMPQLHNVDILKLPYAQDGSGRSVAPTSVTVNGFDVIEKSLSDSDVFQPGDDEIFFVAETGELILGADVVADMRAGNDFTIEYNVSNLRIGDLNPQVFFNAMDEDEGMDHRINFEFSPGIIMHVNAQARDIFTDRMYADLRNLLDFAESIVPPDRRLIEQYFLDPANNYNFAPGSKELAAKVEERLVEETQLIMQALNHRVNNMLNFMEGHSNNAIGRHTELGVRMTRLDSMFTALDEDHTNLEGLKSDNEDVDFFDVLEKFRIMERAHEGALQVIANNIQLTLLGFI
jgi:flagellar hook-associated protein 3 FlgL